LAQRFGHTSSSGSHKDLLFAALSDAVKIAPLIDDYIDLDQGLTLARPSPFPVRVARLA
jgi:hypothetical protein